MDDGIQATASSSKIICVRGFPIHAVLVSYPPITGGVATALINNLTAFTWARRLPEFDLVFSLNSTTYLHPKLLKPREPILGILPRPMQDTINSNSAPARWVDFDSKFPGSCKHSPGDKDKSGSGGKLEAKEKFTRFFDLLEGAQEMHQLARVLGDNEEQRQSIEEEALKLVVPSSQRFT